MPLQVGAGFRLRSGRRAVAFAGFAGFQTRDAQLRGHSVAGFFQRDLQVVTKIGAALRCRAARAAATTAKHIAETKQIAEDVFDATEARRAPACAGAAGNSCMTKAVVTLALFGIGQHAVGFGCFLELLFRGRVVRILVRVITYSPDADRRFLIPDQ